MEAAGMAVHAAMIDHVDQGIGEIVQKLKDKKITVFQSYGMTETISHVAIRKIGFETEEYYQALPGISFSSEEQRLIID